MVEKIDINQTCNSRVFEGMKQERVNLNNTDLRGANFIEANLTRVSLQGAKYDFDAFDKSINV